MITIAGLYGPERRTSPEAEARLKGAYYRVFFGIGATKEDQNLVVSDLAVDTRFFFTEGINHSADEMRTIQGKRAVMARILRLGMGELTDLSGLYLAAVQQQAANQEDAVFARSATANNEGLND